MKNKHNGICDCGCGEKLPATLTRTNMDHTLEKREYPECKFSVSNIKFYLDDHHANKSMGFLTKNQQKFKEDALKNYTTLCEESRIFEQTLKDIIWQKLQIKKNL